MSDVKSNIEATLSTVVTNEKANYESGTAFITEGVSFQMRNLTRLLRRNYYGIFKSPQDPATGRNKVWIPLTETFVDSVVKNIDLDTKDINIRAKVPSAVPISHIVRHIVKNELENIQFGELLDRTERTLAIDGAAVWKTMSQTKDGKPGLQVYLVDNLNLYYDPTANELDFSDTNLLERSVMSKMEFKEMAGDDWINMDDIATSTTVSRYDDDQVSGSTAFSSKTSEMVEVYEYWGRAPKFVVSGDEEDQQNTDIHAIGTMAQGAFVPHFIEENKKGVKPYLMCPYIKVPNRLQGKGIAEKLMNLQVWVNTIANIRVNREYVTQLGLFTVEEGSGITEQQLSRLPATGAMMVRNHDDIRQLPVSDIPTSSFNEEQNIQSWAERTTSLFEAATGETLPASTPATNAVLSSRSAQSQFTMVKENVGMFIEQWMNNFALPIIMKNLKRKDVIRATGDPQDLADLDEAIANKLIYEELKKSNEEGKIVDPEAVERERQNILEKLRKMEDTRYFEMLSDVKTQDFDVEVYVTNEKFDKGVMVQNLISALQVAPEYRQEVVDQIFDLMGIKIRKREDIVPQPEVPQQEITQQNLGAIAATGQGIQQQVTGANIPV